VILSRAHPVSDSGLVETIDLEDAASRARLLELYATPVGTWLRLNLITTVSGSAAGADGTSESLTNPADRRILGVIRELADVVLVGAQSVRAEGYLMPRRSRLAVLTASGDLGGHRIATSIAAGSLLVLCPSSAVDAARTSLGDVPAEIVTVADARDGRLDPAAVIAALHDRGLRSIVCEGGPSLAAQFAAHDLIDELCIATSPQFGGVSFPLLPGDTGSVRQLRLEQLLVDDASGVYARWIAV